MFGIKQVVIFLVLVAFINESLSSKTSQLKLKNEWNNFKNKYNKIYKNAKEDFKRFVV